MRRLTLATLVLTPLLLALLPGVAAAQQSRPYRGLFGGGYGETDQSLIFSSSLGTGFDTNVLRGRIDPAAEDENPIPTRRSSTFTSAQLGLGYSISRSTLSLSASTGTSVSYYEALAKPRVNGYGASFSASWRPNYRMSLSASESLSYGPFLGLSSIASLIETGAGAPPLEFLQSDIIVEDRLLSSASASFGYSVTKNIGVSAGYGQQDDLWSSDVRDLASKAANVGISYGRQVRKFFGFRVGYSYQLSQYRGSDLEPQWVGSHGGDIGLNFGRNGALELNRRTRLSFGVGVGSGRGLRPGERLHYTVTGNAGLTRDVGRTFQASLQYNRGLGFNSFFREPVVSDTLTAGYGGLLTRRLTFHSGVSANRGNVGFNQDDNQLIAYAANAGLGLGLTRLLSLNVTYFWTQFEVGSFVALPTGVERIGDRHVVRASISFRAPLYTRARRPNASR